MTRDDARLRLGLTDAGRVVLRGIVFVALAAMIIPAFGVLSALVSVMIVALLVAFVLRPRIHVSANIPDRLVVGQTAQLRYVLSNGGRLPAYNLRVRFGALPEAIEQVTDGQEVWRLGPGQTAELTVAIRPRRRGNYRIRQPVCLSSFPFNLFSFSTSPDYEEPLIVLPAFSLLQIPRRGPCFRRGRPAPAHAGVRAGGVRFAARTGVWPEYAGNRPFLPGDSPRTIDARAWARLSVPVTKEYHDDLDNYSALLLDTRVPAGRPWSRLNEIRELEAAVSLCASVAFTVNNDCLIDFLLAGPDLHQFTAWPRTERLDKIHEILAGVEPSSGYCLEKMPPILAERFDQVSEVVFILLSWDKAYQQLLELAEQAGCHSTVLLIGRSNEKPVDQDNVSRTANVHFLSADEILAGQIVRL